MILDQRKVDDVDKVQLITAMMAANAAEDRLPEGEIYRVPPNETGEFGFLAEVALNLIAEMHRESEDDWDGVVWFELFEDSHRDSLADKLVEFCMDYEVATEQVRPVVIEWLKDRNR